MEKYIISVTAKDRPGIVAEISKAMVDLSGSILAASQTVHQGYFAMIMLYSFESKVSSDKISEAINSYATEPLHIYATEYIKPKPVASPQSKKQPFIITAIGPDKPGILHLLAEYLGTKAINIDDLYARVEEGNFLVICQVSVPTNMDVYMIQADLESAGTSMGVSINMQHENVFVATNELGFQTNR